MTIETQQDKQGLSNVAQCLRRVMEKRDYAKQTHAERMMSFLCLIDPDGLDGAVEKFQEALENSDYDEAYDDGENYEDFLVDWTSREDNWLDWFFEQEDISCSCYGLMFDVSIVQGELGGCRDCAFKLGNMRGEIDWGWGAGQRNHKGFEDLCKEQGVAGLLSIATRDLRQRGCTLWVYVDEEEYKMFELDFATFGHYKGWVTKTEDEADMHELSSLLCNGKVQRFADTAAYKAE